jgi:hypothetical protein
MLPMVLYFRKRCEAQHFRTIPYSKSFFIQQEAVLCKIT